MPTKSPGAPTGVFADIQALYMRVSALERAIYRPDASPSTPAPSLAQMADHCDRLARKFDHDVAQREAADRVVPFISERDTSARQALTSIIRDDAVMLRTIAAHLRQGEAER